MGVPGFDVRMKRHVTFLMFILLISLGLFAAGCKVGAGEVREDEGRDSVPTGRVISGGEALRLYGIEPGIEIGLVEPSSTQDPWFPMQVWVCLNSSL